MAKKRRIENKPDEEPDLLELPDRRAMERMMREIAAGLGGDQCEETSIDRAQELMFRAFEATGAEQVHLARQALKVSPDCADAYVLLAEHAETADEAQMLEERILHHESLRLGNFPKAVRDKGCDERKSCKPDRAHPAIEAGQDQSRSSELRYDDSNRNSRSCRQPEVLSLDNCTAEIRELNDASLKIGSAKS